MKLKIIPANKKNIKKNMESILSIDYYVIGEKWSEQNFVMELPGKWEFSLIAFDGDILVGFCIASVKEGKVHLHRLAIDHSRQGNKIGKSIILELARHAMQKKVSIITLKVNKGNKTAQNFYTALGFEKKATHGENILLDCIVNKLVSINK